MKVIGNPDKSGMETSWGENEIKETDNYFEESCYKEEKRNC